MAVTDRTPLSEFVVRRTNGQVGNGAVCRVLDLSLAVVPYYTARVGGTVSTAPHTITADSRGLLSGWVPIVDDGFYIEVVIDGITYPNQLVRPGSSVPNSSVATAQILDGTVARADLAAATIQTARTTTGSIAVNATAAVVVTWPTAFADANYTVVATIEDNTAGGATGLLAMTVQRIRSKAAASCTIQVANNSGASALTGTIHAVAFHD